MGFEVVVRPAILPNIRPAPAQSLPPLDDPDKGFAVIRGNGAKQIDLSSSWSSSSSTNQQKETQRRVDEARVYQQNDDGTVNKDNFVDIEVVNKLWMKGPKGNFTGFNGDDVVSTVPGRGYTGDDVVPVAKKQKPEVETNNEVKVQIYDPIKGSINIDVKRKNVIKKAAK